jgi:hypothetical protein
MDLLMDREGQVKQAASCVNFYSMLNFSIFKVFLKRIDFVLLALHTDKFNLREKKSINTVGLFFDKGNIIISKDSNYTQSLQPHPSGRTNAHR